MSHVILGIFVAILLIIAFLVVKHWAKIKTFKEEVMQEMYKVAWPGKDEVINSTVLVFVVAIIMTIAVGAVDTVFGFLVRLMF